MADDDSEAPKVEKLYCCGNSSQQEALYVSRLNFALAVFWMLLNISFAVILASYPDLVSKLPLAEILKDYKALLNRQSALLKWSILVSLPIYDLLKIGLAAMLTYGAQQRATNWLTWWFILTVLMTIVDVAIWALLATSLRAVGVCIGIAVAIFLYNWYALWICWVLIRRSKAISKGLDVPSLEDLDSIVGSATEPSPVVAHHSQHHNHHHHQHHHHHHHHNQHHPQQQQPMQLQEDNF